MESVAPFSAQKAESEVAKLRSELDKLGQEIIRITAEAKSAEQLVKHQAQVFPLVEKMRALEIQAKRLEIPRKEVEARIFDTANKSVSPSTVEKAKSLWKDTLNHLEDIGGHVRDRFRKKVEETRTRR